MISVKSMLHAYAAGLTKDWSHDRLSTVGASEIGQCLRKTAFAKSEAPGDSDYVDRFGARLRGELIESAYVVPGLRASLPKGVELLYAGDEQQTLVDGYLSATPDGLLTGVARDCLAHLGITDIGSDCLALEIKSIDPRVDLKIEKPEHSFQTQCQMGLFRHAGQHRPEYALICYIDASFLDDVREFAVKFDERIYQAAHARAFRVMDTLGPLDLPPEGKLSGGKECQYCPWSSHCAAITVAGIPKDDKPLGDNAVAALKALRDEERQRAAAKDDAEAKHLTSRHDIEEFLRANGVRGYKAADWAVSWFSVKGRETVDIKAAEAAGIDLSAFKSTGSPSARLNVK
jgi:hypothetical protein